MQPLTSHGVTGQLLLRFSIAWLAVALPLGVALLTATLDRRPLDDSDLVFQRPGFLDAHGRPFTAPRLTAELLSPVHGWSFLSWAL